MTNQEILGKAILKAGRKHFRYKGKYSFSPWEACMKEIIIGLTPYEPLIFSHDFAKAFWGNEELEKEKGRTFEQYWEEEKESLLHCGLTKEDTESDWITDIPVEEAWAYHLKQIVLEKKPLKYLEKFL